MKTTLKKKRYCPRPYSVNNAIRNPSRVIIDRTAVQHNFDLIRLTAKTAKVMAIVKMDAYNHGLLRIASVLRNTDALGVSCLAEGEQLRKAGVTQPVVILKGVLRKEDMLLVTALQLDLVVHNEIQLTLLEQASSPALQVWVKVDTGMHRLGFQPNQLGLVLSRIAALNLIHRPRLMSHFAAANEPDNGLNQSQLSVFNTLAANTDLEKSIANSAAILSNVKAHMDWVRPGLMLYGVSPFPDRQASDHDLRPAMTLTSELIAIQHLKKGDTVGYGARWCCPADMPIGIVAIGYGDGYPRHASAGTPVLVNGKRCYLAGHISMDMLAVDLRPCIDAQVGDPVVLWGDGLPIEAIAEAANTIPYQLLCGVHKRLEVITRD